MVLFLLNLLFSQYTTTYRWPIPILNRNIISNLCDFRPTTTSDSSHFHAGIDIPSDSSDVISYTYTYIYRDWTWASYGYTIYLQHVSDDSSNTWFNGSRYIHMLDINDSLQVDEYYSGSYLAYKTHFQDDHLHFSYYTPEPLSWDYDSIINPLVPLYINSIVPSDTLPPVLLALYVDDHIFGNANVDNLNFLNYHFDSLYNDTPSFVKLKLPRESKNNDLDDPHIILSGNCKVRFVFEGNDNFLNTSDRGAPYIYALYYDYNIDNMIDSIQTPIYETKFDYILAMNSELYQEEDVYYINQPCSSGINGPQYYRLYPYDKRNNGFPSCITIKDTLKTENLEEGFHRIRIYTQDYNNLTKTADVHFYIRRNELVDFCKGYRE